MTNAPLAEIEFTIDDKTYAMTPPTPRIIFAAARFCGGIFPMREMADKVDLDYYFMLLRTACPEAPREEAELQAFIVEHLDILIPALTKYWAALQNNGRLPELDRAGADRTANSDAEGKVDPAPVIGS
jgi:hypothetical protein